MNVLDIPQTGGRHQVSTTRTLMVTANQPSPATDLPRVDPRIRGNSASPDWPQQTPGPRRDGRTERRPAPRGGGTGREPAVWPMAQAGEFAHIERPPFPIVDAESELFALAVARLRGHPDLRPLGQNNCAHCGDPSPCDSRILAAEVMICAGEDPLAVERDRGRSRVRTVTVAKSPNNG